MFKISNILLLAFLMLPLLSPAQTINIWAGNGSHIFSGEGGPAIAAGLDNPGYGAFDTKGNYYFNMVLGNRICKIDTALILTTVAGDGTGGFSGDSSLATAAEVNLPADVATDNQDNIYFADLNNFRVRKIDHTTGIITTIAGNGISGYSGDSGLATDAELGAPEAVRVDHAGNVYIADAFSYAVRKVDTFGIITTIAGGSFGHSGGDGGPATAATFEFPSALAIDDSGNIYVGDDAAGVIRKVNTAGIISTFAGVTDMPLYIGEGTAATEAHIAPEYLCTDHLGNLFIGDQYNKRVYKIDASGILHCVAGNGMATLTGMGGTPTAASINAPNGIAVDTCGNLYIPMFDTFRICKVTYDSCMSAPTTAISNVQPLSEITIYPNPARNELTITNNNIQQVTIGNMLGQTVFTQSYHTQKAQINIANLPQGLYFVKVNDGYVQKVVKE